VFAGKLSPHKLPGRLMKRRFIRLKFRVGLSSRLRAGWILLIIYHRTNPMGVNEAALH
jgi:hypothetical protein